MEDRDFKLLKIPKAGKIQRMGREDYDLILSSLKIFTSREQGNLKIVFDKLSKYLTSNIMNINAGLIPEEDPNYPLICKIDDNGRIGWNVSSIGKLPIQERNLFLSSWLYCVNMYFSIGRDKVPFIEWFNIGSIMTGIITKMFGRRYGIFNMETKDLEKLDFYCHMFSLVGLARNKDIQNGMKTIISSRRYRTPGDYFIKDISEDLNEFKDIVSFLNLLGKEILPGMNKFEFSSTILNRMGINNLVIFDDINYFSSSIAATLYHNKLFPPIYKMFNDFAYGNMLRYYKDNLFKYEYRK